MPSLSIRTSVDFGSKQKKVEFMKACSASLAKCFNKPESFVCVVVEDNSCMIWGGEETNCALGTLSSLGSICEENNAAFQAELTALLEPFGVPADKMYIAYTDVARENMGYNSKTFAR